MTLKELQLRAKELGIKGYSKMRKDDLATAVATSEQRTPAPVVPPIMEPGPIEVATRKLAAYQAMGNKRRKRNEAKARRRQLRAQGFSVGFVR